VGHDNQHIAFGEFRIALADERLFGPLGPIKLGKKAFQTLLCLVQAEGGLVTKDALFSSVWDGTIVTESALTSVIKEIRRSLGDNTRKPDYVETVYGRGYRFIPEVRRVEANATDSLLSGLAESAQSQPVGSKSKRVEGVKGEPKPTSICVLPFVSMSADAEQDYFSDGITEDITTDLSKIPALSVVARNTAFTFKGAALDVTSIACKLGVSYILEGSVRKAGNRVRISAQLVDTATGDHLWAERYDRDLTDIFAIQDEISNAISEALKVTILPEERSIIERRGTSDSEAYNLYLVARQYWTKGNLGDPRREERTGRICERATEIDPDYARAWALLARAQSTLKFNYDRPTDGGLAAAERAVTIDPSMAEAYCVFARHHTENGRYAEADIEIAKAMKLNPDSWEVNKELGRLCMLRSQFKEAKLHFSKAVEIMDSDLHSWTLLATCYGVEADSKGIRNSAEKMVKHAERAVADHPSNSFALGVGAGGFAMLGEVDRAREWMDRALLVDPDNLHMRYNFACVLTKYLDDKDSAIALMEGIFKRTYPVMIKHAETDPDLATLRDDPRFQKILADAKNRVSTQSAE
jgi:adenylate cyclase